MIDERYGFPPDFDFRDIEDENQIQYGPNGEMLSGAAAITTGATDAQIEAAAERLFNFRMTGDANTSHRTGNAPTWKIVSRRKYEAPIREAADFLVPTDHRIVRVDDLRAIAELLAYDEYNVDMTSQEERDRYWRIVALIGEDE